MCSTRLFFALWPDAQTASALHAAAEQIIRDGQRVPQSQLHMTLAFIGTVRQAAVADLVARMQAVHAQQFTLQLQQVGYFARPRIAWLGPSQTPNALTQLVDSVAQLTLPHRSRQVFKPHVSLARGASKPDHQHLATPIKWHASSFHLVESGSGGQPGRYKCLYEWPLGDHGSYDCEPVE